jgi:hypothetical protein
MVKAGIRFLSQIIAFGHIFKKPFAGCINIDKKTGK